jgi:drug/metabolite transporter (DMT)-like permease
MFLADHLGEAAAFVAAVCWTACSIAFANAGRQVGSLCVNIIRLLIAVSCLMLVGIFAFQEIVPIAPAAAWGYLALSGVIGFFLGDLCLFQSYVMIGPRLGLLVLSLWPPISALLAWPLLGEELSGVQWIGMAVALGGVATVVIERPGDGADAGARRHYLVGILLAVVASFCQAAGYVISKLGMRIMDPDGVIPVRVSFQATQMRLLAATVAFVVLFTVARRWRVLGKAVRHKNAMAWLAFGAIVGPFLGVVLSLYAMYYTQAGIAATIMATAPILILPYAVLVDKEKVKPLTVLGAAIAFVGIAMLAMGKA